jgi:hypothetical protein
VHQDTVNPKYWAAKGPKAGSGASLLAEFSQDYFQDYFGETAHWGHERGVHDAPRLMCLISGHWPFQDRT